MAEIVLDRVSKVFSGGETGQSYGRGTRSEHAAPAPA